MFLRVTSFALNSCGLLSIELDTGRRVLNVRILSQSGLTEWMKRDGLTRKLESSKAVITFLVVVGVMFGSFYLTPSISAPTTQNTCIGIGGWACGYTGPFTGEYYAGYATLGCTPTSANNPCAVPQIARLSSFLVIGNVPYVIDWASQSFKMSNSLADGITISVSGDLASIFYNKTAGSTFMIYASNAKGLWNPQPQLQIQNATLTTQLIGSVTTQPQSISSTCTTTLTFTVSGPANGVWNLPMVPAGTCIAVRNIAQQESYAVGNMDIPFTVVILASSVGGVSLIMICALMLMKNRRKENRQ